MLTTATTAMTTTIPSIVPSTLAGHSSGWLDRVSTCTPDEAICQQVLSWTDSQRAADAADLAIGRPVAIVGLIVLGLVIRWVLFKVVHRVVKQAEAGVLPDRLTDRFASANATRRVQRAKTMGDLLKSIITGVLVAVFGTMILAQVGVNIAPIIASAGIVGVALGFGAQSLVKDFLSGIFLILEDQYGVGDLVDTGMGTVGTIEAVGLRVTRLRDGTGVVWYVRNGEILKVGNHSQGWSTGIVDVSVAYNEDIPKVQRIVGETATAMAEEESWSEKIIEPPTVAGVESVTATSVTIRVIVKCSPNEHFGVQRELRERIKEAFDREDVRVPPPVFPGSPGPL